METPQPGFVEEIDFNELHFLEIVGRGAFGVVSRAQWRNHDVAVKLIETESERKAFITELKQLSRISHPHIVKLYGACTKQPVGLVMEYAEGGSLYNVLHGSPPFPKYTAAHAVSWALQCARGVEYLHGMKPKALIHRDLKPPNLLLVSGGTVLKICDFGTACDAHTHMTNNKGSAAWMAPEVFEGCNYSEKCDVFSWGIILWEIIARSKPFDEIGGSAFRVMWAVHSGKRPPLVKDCPKALETLMTRCWSSNPVERPSMTEVVRIMTRFSQLLKGEDQPLVYPSRRDSSEERIHQSSSHPHFDSRSSTVRATIRQPEAAFGSEFVPLLAPVTPQRKPVVVEDNSTDLRAPSSRRSSRESLGDASKPVVVTQSPESTRSASVDPSNAAKSNGPPPVPPKPPVRTHRRTGSHGTASVTTATQQPFVPGHRRSGSQGNAVVTATADQFLLPGNALTSVTTAPGNLEDANHEQHNNVAARSVSWTPGVPGLWPQGSGSAEDVRDTPWNFIDPQLKPVPPCTACPESVDIYNQHLKVIDDYMKIQAEISHFELRKEQLMAELNLDENVRLNTLKQDYEGLLVENDELKLLFTNLQKQVALIKEQ